MLKKEGSDPFTSSAASGSNAVSLSTGQRLDLGAGASDYLVSDGSNISTPSGFTAANLNIPSIWDITADGTGTTVERGYKANGGSTISLRKSSGVSLTTAGAKIQSFENNLTEKLAVGKNGQFHTPVGNADSVAGTATLSSGTVTVNTTAVSANSLIFTSRNTAGGTVGHLNAPVASIVAATSFVINSSSGTDASTVNWWIVN